MTYKLAKELKDAGFPQSLCSRWMTVDNSYSGALPENIKNGDIITFQPKDGAVANPSLSELIEACGDKFMDLRYKQLGDNPPWYCCGNNLGGTHCLAGRTPSEAVARLWLALNKK